jgi:hypothetical protein
MMYTIYYKKKGSVKMLKINLLLEYIKGSLKAKIIIGVLAVTVVSTTVTAIKQFSRQYSTIQIAAENKTDIEVNKQDYYKTEESIKETKKINSEEQLGEFKTIEEINTKASKNRQEYKKIIEREEFNQTNQLEKKKSKQTYEEYKSFTFNGNDEFVIGGAGQLDFGKLTSKSTVQEFNEETAELAKYAGMGASKRYLKSKLINKRVGNYVITDIDISFYIGNGLDEYNFPLDSRGIYDELLTKGLEDIPNGLFSVAVRKLDFASEKNSDSKCRAVKLIVKFKKI